LGVCIATSGPGGIHLLNGLYDAKMDHAPVLAITGLQHSDLIGTFTQQDVALDNLLPKHGPVKNQLDCLPTIAESLSGC
jgi:thiamine pyrophosphate-dependent acetolactate synthase large subunit-like protein